MLRILDNQFLVRRLREVVDVYNNYDDRLVGLDRLIGVSSTSELQDSSGLVLWGRRISVLSRLYERTDVVPLKPYLRG